MILCWTGKNYKAGNKFLREMNMSIFSLLRYFSQIGSINIILNGAQQSGNVCVGLNAWLECILGLFHHHLLCTTDFTTQHLRDNKKRLVVWSRSWRSQLSIIWLLWLGVDFTDILSQQIEKLWRTVLGKWRTNLANLKFLKVQNFEQ